MSAGTIIFTGANSSLAIPAVKHFLTNYPDHYAILTIRDPDTPSPHTDKLRAVIAPFQDRVSIRAADLSNLASVRSLTSAITAEIKAGSLPPLTSIICNAYYWNLNVAAELTVDGFEKTFQVNHLAHAILVQQLLESFGRAQDDSHTYCGRIVLFGSDTIFPGQSPLEKYPPLLPEDLQQLAKPTPETDGDHAGHGFQRYSLAKLAIVTWMYALNDHLQKPENSHLRKITTVAINPGNLTDSRALQTNTPFMIRNMSRFLIGPLRPLFSLMDPTMRTAASAGTDVVTLALDQRFEGVKGYFTLLKEDMGPPDSLDKTKQDALWKKTVEWSST
ncbi:Short-chain dehydrogenase [Penicillium angulare]|uniref:Short-chain dehydrogenase n=1 Tax=Penicillium angulare TaxID=116970 RepID=UPI0025400F81|nr:Short-chain dehydrogenase [Penicillium angulare]KAJ5273659.1 Short-chain dehydrogenase [Penicillium angulare]